MTSIAVYRNPVVFSGDGDDLLKTLLDEQIRQQVVAKNSYTGYGRELEPFDFQIQEDNLAKKENINDSQQQQQKQLFQSDSDWKSLEDEDNENKAKIKRGKSGKNGGKQYAGQNCSNSSQKRNKSKNSVKGGDECGQRGNKGGNKFQKNANFSKRKNKRFSQSRQESALAQELTQQNVTKLRGYASDTGGSEVEWFESEKRSGNISFKSESSVSLFYRSGFDGLEFEDHAPDFELMMPSTQYAVPI